MYFLQMHYTRTVVTWMIIHLRLNLARKTRCNIGLHDIDIPEADPNTPSNVAIVTPPPDNAESCVGR
jgi:hypothetical protein